MTLRQFTCILFLSPVSQTAGLHPTAEQIEMFAYHLPDATLSNLVVSISYLYLHLSFTVRHFKKINYF